MIRDQEISRLVKYAEGMGVKVRFLTKTDSPDDAAGWTTDGTEILMYMNNRTPKIELVLSLIHELGHHVWFIHEKNRKPDLKFEEALERQNLYEKELSNTPTPKALRRKILSIEVAGTEWWDIIYQDTGLRFPKWRLEVAKKFDIWVYEQYYETGFFPSRKLGRQEYNRLVKELKK